MFHKLQLATVIAVTLSAIGPMGSADAHIGGRGGGIRLGGGLAPRARQAGIGNRGNGNFGVVRVPAPAPAPKAAVAPPIVPIAGTNSGSGTKLPVTTLSPTSNSKSIVKAQSPSVPAPVPANVQAAPATTAIQPPAAQPVALSSETKPAPPEVPAADLPATASAPTEVVKEVANQDVALPKIPVGATVTLNGKDLSDKPGQVMLQIGDIAVPATIKEWKNDAVICTLPVLGLTKASQATLHVLKADGKTASTMRLELVTSLPTSTDTNPSGFESASFER